MMELSRYVLETLREDQEFALYRGRQHGNPLPVLLLTPAAEQPTPASLKRLEHEYSLAAELDAAWAARPLGLTRHDGRPMLVLEDFGGEPLDRTLGQPLALTRFLRIAIGLVAALGQVHRHGIIHKDIKPANVLIVAAGNVRLTGFGIATRLLRERQEPAPPEVIAGTLAYMAPEQTGRMNRSVDSRSDLYSLGVTLYEILTGMLPFTATEPMEWIHCHIARLPMPPSERTKDIPGPVEAIILKLLAKTAEDRYQTAAGVEADLRWCLTAWEAHGRIDAFLLGAHDASDRLLIPEKLYGREAEIEILLASLDRVVASGKPELVLVSGYSGIGKSSVVNELHKVLVPPRGLFASGKFDQYKRDIPYSTLAQAFEHLVHSILGLSEMELDRWRDNIRHALGPNGQLMVNLVPQLELIIGEQRPVPELPPQDAQNRFQMVFQRFIGVFARPEHPLALFLDDLQWLDAATLDLFEYLVSESELHYLLLVGAYRDNEVDSAHPLMRKLEAIRNAGATVKEIVLAPLTYDDLGQLIADSLHCELDQSASLTRLIHEKTAGNPFFVIQFVSALAEEELLTFDHGAARWSWDLKRIHATGYTDNVVDILVGKLSRLPVKTQKALEQLACVGNSAEFSTLTMVYPDSKENIHGDLWEAVRTGLVFRSEDGYRFLHDRVQEAAYSLIPEGARAAAHIQIGRLLALRVAPVEIEEKIFEIVNQLNRGASVIQSPEERTRVAALNLIAGKRAKAATAYASALTYLVAGRAFLPEDSWEQQFRLIFDLELHRAECEFLTGDTKAAEARLLTLWRRGVDLADLAAVVWVATALYVTAGRGDRAVGICLEYLHRVGIAWSHHPTDEEVQHECRRLWAQIANRPIETLIDLPPMTDRSCRATMDVMAGLLPAAYFFDNNLLALVIVRMTNLTLEHGNCDGSSYAYSALSLVLGPRFGDYQSAFRFGKLGLDLVEHRGLDRFKARVYLGFGILVLPWTRPLRDSLKINRRAVDAAFESGDLPYAAFSRSMVVASLVACGEPLAEVLQEAELALGLAQKAHFGLVIHLITPQIQFARTLRGLTADFASFNDEQFDEHSFEQHVEGDPTLVLVACWYWIRKLQAHFYAENFVAAMAAATKMQALLWASPPFFETAEYHFYGALALAAHSHAVSTDERPGHLAALVTHHEQIELWAKDCPETFANRAALVGAEIARLEGREIEAERLYEEAICSARENGFIQNESIANELAARFYAGRGFQTIANTYLRNARYCYLRWGADGKVRQLDQMHPHLREEQARPGPTTTIATQVEQLDLATIVKVSQAVSGEIVLEKLLQTLMVIALEHAGAGRGLLIFPRGAEMRIEAEATTGRATVEVRLRQAAVTPSELPESMLHFVIRTRESVVLDDASAPNQFSTDEYIRQKHSRSVLCLPIVKQSKLIGVLYLENHLAAHVFTPARIAVLKLLASQAAISLENARLYDDLQRENSERKRAEDELRKSEAYLAEAQRISRTGSFGWNVASGELFWSDETYRIVGVDQGTKPTLELVFQRIHPEDIASVQETLDRGVAGGTDMDFEHRFLLPDGSVKYVHVVAHAVPDHSGNIEYVGAAMDITAKRRVEDELRKGEEKYRDLVELSPDAIYVIDKEGNLISANPAGLELLRCTAQEAVGMPVAETCLPEERAMHRTRLETLRTGGRLRFERIVVRKDGTHVPAEILASSIRHGYSQAVVRDISERKQAESKLQRSEAYLAEAQKLSRTGSWACTDRLETTYWSEELFRIIGLPAGDNPPSTKEIGKYFAPETWAKIKELFETARRKKITCDGEFPMVLSGGSNRMIRIVGHPVLNAAGDIVEFVGTTIDVTEQREARAALERALVEVKKSEDRLRVIIDTIPALAWSTLADGSTEFLNQRWLDYTGLSVEEALEWGWSIVIHPEDLANSMNKWRTILASGESGEHEARMRRFDGEYRWFLTRVVPLRDENGNIIRWYGTNTDIEDRKQAEEIRTAQARQASVRADVSAALSQPAHLREILRGCAEAIVRHLDAAFARIWTLNTEKNLLELQASAGMYTHLNGPHSRIQVGKLKIGLIAQEKKPHLTNDVLNDPRVSDKAWAQNEGMVSFAGYPLIVQNRVVGVMAMFARKRLTAATLDTLASVADSIAQGIERKRTGEQIRQSEAYLAEAQRLSHTGSFGWNVASGELFWSDQTYRIVGVDQETKPILERVFQRIHPEDIARVQQTLDRASHDGKDFDFEHRFLMPNGSIKYVHLVAHAVKDESGNLEYVGALMDITRHKQGEDALRKAQGELAHVTRVMTMGELAASIAHEVNQPLTAVIANANASLRWLATATPNLDEAREAVSRIVRDGNRAGDVIARIRALIQKTDTEKTQLNINQTVDEVVMLIQNEAGRKGVTLRMDLAANVPPVLGDRVQLQQVILNLVMNGVEAMASMADRPRELLICSRQHESDQVLIAVQDSGIGIDAQNLERIFDAFYSTKSQGMGMGLAISRSIVENHGGRLWAVPNDGPGTTFQFTLLK